MSCFATRSPPGPRRRAPTARVDLHCHSTASDGEFAPAVVARRAREAGLAAIALTDHDTTAGVAEAASTGADSGVRVVCGCEFSVKAPWGELHLLGYFLDPDHVRLQEFLAGTRAARRRRAEQMVTRLRQLGVGIELGQVETAANGGALGRPHVARVLVERGVSADIGEAFDRYLGRGRPGYVEKPLPPRWGGGPSPGSGWKNGSSEKPGETHEQPARSGHQATAVHRAGVGRQDLLLGGGAQAASRGAGVLPGEQHPRLKPPALRRAR